MASVNEPRPLAAAPKIPIIKLKSLWKQNAYEAQISPALMVKKIELEEPSAKFS